MSKRQVIMLLGVWIMIFPFMGFPSGWKEVLAVITGFIIVIVAYRMAPGENGRSDRNNEGMPFIEHKAKSKLQSAITGAINNSSPQ